MLVSVNNLVLFMKYFLFFIQEVTYEFQANYHQSKIPKFNKFEAQIFS